MTYVDTALVAGVVSLASGLLVPNLVARLPEPRPAGPDEGAGAVVADEPPKELYADLAARPWLRGTSAVASGIAGGLAGLVLGWDWGLLLVLFVVPLGVALAVVDHRTRLLPTIVVVPATWVVIALVVADWARTGEVDDLRRAAIGLVAARFFYWVLWWIRSAGMGFGDVRLAALLGGTLGYLGWSQLVVGMYAGFLIFGLPGLLLAVVRRDRALLRTAFPFGPFMLAGALIGVVVGEPVLARLVGG